MVTFSSTIIHSEIASVYGNTTIAEKFAFCKLYLNAEVYIQGLSKLPCDFEFIERKKTSKHGGFTNYYLTLKEKKDVK